MWTMKGPSQKSSQWCYKLFTKEASLAEWAERIFTSMWWDYSLRNPAWNFKNSCKMYILLHNQSCFNIKIKWSPVTPLKSFFPSNLWVIFTLKQDTLCLSCGFASLACCHCLQRYAYPSLKVLSYHVCGFG